MISRLFIGLCPLLFLSSPQPQEAVASALSPVHDCVEIERIEFQTRSSNLERLVYRPGFLGCPDDITTMVYIHYDVTEVYVIVKEFEFVTYGVVGAGGAPILCGSTTTQLSETEVVIGWYGDFPVAPRYLDCAADAGECCYLSYQDTYETVTLLAPTTSTLTQFIDCDERGQTIRKVVTTTTTKESVTKHYKTQYVPTGADDCDDDPCEEKIVSDEPTTRVKSKVTKTSYPDGLCP